MEAKHHGHLVLDYMRSRKVMPGDQVSIDAVVEYGFDHGAELNELEDALIRASANGWILAADHYLQLTKSGYALLHPANDNFSAPG
jgi:hypothetical protein